MNTHDMIELPPLPPGYKSYEFPDGGYDEDEMRAYARAAIEAALQSQDRVDAERLDWLLRKLPGDAIRYCVGVLDDTADAEEFRAAIDHARRVEGGGK